MLFRTRFEIMDDSEGRSQTTKGIWLACADRAAAFVLDVEGTDSSSRGEDHVRFERKSALLLFALADVVIMNMWENDLGRFEGANLSLLRTVFEVNLQLRTDDTRTLFLFVIRDWAGRTPLVKLAASVTRELKQIWNNCNKVCFFC
jgi:protein SEY1